MQLVHVTVPPTAGPLTRRAVTELHSYLPRIWDVRVEAVDHHGSGNETVDPDLRLTVGEAGDPHVSAALNSLDEHAEVRGEATRHGTDRAVADGFSLRSGAVAGVPAVVVVGGGDAGVLYGVYELLELVGVRFYLSGDSMPRRGPLFVPEVNLDRSPTVRLRGFMPYTDFLPGPTTWDLEDYVAVIDQAARLRLNLFSMHFYTFEPVGQFQFKGRARTEAFWDTSRTTRWHKRPGRLSEFVVGREHFSAYQLAADTFGSRAAIEAVTAEDRFRLAEADIRAAFAHAKSRGMHTTIGVEITDPPLEFRELVNPADRFGDDEFGICASSHDARQLLTEWLSALAATFPDIDTFTLWQSENGPSRWTPGCPCPECVRFRAEHPLPEYTVDDLLGKVSSRTYDVADITQSAQTFLQWVLLGYDILKEVAADKQVALAGWYIEHMFRDATPYLPEDLVLSSMTEVDPWEAPPLLDHYQGVDRRTWLINWWEIDFRMWLPQPKVSAYPPILDKVAAYSIDAVIWQHWRTRSVDDNARYTSVAMWQPGLTPQQYYRDAFEVEWGEEAATEATEAMVLFEAYEQWLCHDLGYQVFAQDWFPPTLNHALEFLAVHGAIPQNVVDDVTAKLAELPAIRARLQAVQAKLTSARVKAQPLRDGDRPGFWQRRLDYYQLYIDCLEYIGKAALAYHEATSGPWSIASRARDLKRAYDSLRDAPVLEFITCLSNQIEDKGDLGTLVNLNNELWTRYRDALDNLTRWFTDSAVGGMWRLRRMPDGSLRSPVVSADALRAEGQWS